MSCQSWHIHKGKYKIICYLRLSFVYVVKKLNWLKGSDYIYRLRSSKYFLVLCNSAFTILLTALLESISTLKHFKKSS